MISTDIIIVRPDAKGRITLGKLASGISSFEVKKKGGSIILEPRVEIPAREKWLFENKNAMKQLAKGLSDSLSGRVSKKKGFAKYLTESE